MSRLRAWLQLMRIGNVFTAVADVLAGALFAAAQWEHTARVAIVAAASALLYAAGMVLNDVFDIRKDSVERPERPLPSRAVSLRSAAFAGAAMLLAAWAVLAALQPSTALCGTGLVLAIIAYDAVLKNTPFAPALMGLCRALNLALGMLIVSGRWRAEQYLAAFLFWLYITCVTAFARREAAASSTKRLQWAWAGVRVAVLSLVLVPLTAARPHRPSLHGILAMLAAVLLLFILWVPAAAAVRSRAPRDVQRAVRTFVLAIPLFDAVLVLSARGPLAALLVAGLSVPALLVSRWIRPT